MGSNRLFAQLVESQTLTDSGVNAASKTFTGVSISRDDGTSISGRYMLGAFVAVAGATAGVTINSVSYGGTALAPDAPGQATAASRPAVRTFTAGAWPTGSNSLVVTCSGSVDSVVVYLCVLADVADACLPAYETGIATDTFNRLSLNPKWSFAAGDTSGVTVTPVNLGSAQQHGVQFDINNSSGEWWQSAEGSLLYQTTNNADFDIRVDFGTLALGQGILSQGFVLWQDDDNWIRCDRLKFSGQDIILNYAVCTNNSMSGQNPANNSFTHDLRYIRIQKAETAYVVFLSTDGTTWTQNGAFSNSFTINRVGIYLAKGSGNITQNGNFLTFNNFLDNTRPVEDANTALQFLSGNASSATTINLAFTENTTTGAGLVDMGIVAADDAAGAITVGTDDDLLAQGVVSSTNGIRYAILGRVIRPVSGTSTGVTITGNWTGAANAAAAGLQFRLEFSREPLIRVTESNVARALTLPPSGNVLGRVTETGNARALATSRAAVLGRATETGNARALVASRSYALGRATESSTARALASVRALTLGRPSESDVARALNSARSSILGRVSETDVARALSASGQSGLNRVTESSTARALGVARQHLLGRATESNAARPLATSRNALLGRASETSTARALEVREAGALGRALETDTARAFALTKQVQLARTTEVDSARALTPARQTGAGRATEADIASNLTLTRVVALGRATEADSARSLSAAGQTVAGRATETDSARALAVTRTVLLGRATETGAARAFSPARQTEAGRATESSAARAFSLSRIAALGRVTETDSAREFEIFEEGAIGRARETGNARALGVVKRIQLGRATESSTARTLLAARTQVLGRATETSTARILSLSRVVALQRALESSAARPFTLTRRVALERAVETGLAQDFVAARTYSIARVSETDRASAFTKIRGVLLGRALEPNIARQLSVTFIAPPPHRFGRIELSISNDITSAIIANDVTNAEPATDTGDVLRSSNGDGG